MRAAMYYGNHKLEIEDIPEPSPEKARSRFGSAATASAAPICTSTTTGRSSSRPISRTR